MAAESACTAYRLAIDEEKKRKEAEMDADAASAAADK